MVVDRNGEEHQDYYHNCTGYSDLNQDEEGMMGGGGLMMDRMVKEMEKKRGSKELLLLLLEVQTWGQ